MTAAIIDRIRAADNLPSLPTVAMEVLRLSQSDDVSVVDIAKVVQQDPALTGKILKLVNSAIFGIPREVSSLKQAMVVLGLRTVKVLALSFSVVDSMNAGAEGEFDYTLFWRRSLTSAVAARLFAKAINSRQTEEAFVCGLLSDLGLIAAWRAAPDLYQPVLDARTKSQSTLCELELEQLGTTHAQLTQELLETWGLPVELCVSVGSHHGQGLDASNGESSELGKIVYSACLVSDLFCEEVPMDRLEGIKQQCTQLLGFDDEVFDAALEALDERVREAASVLSVGIGKTINYTQIQADAAIRLAQLSMEAEFERAASSRREENVRTELTRVQEERELILEAASTDSLTKIANRAAFDKRLDEELASARNNSHDISLILMDVDHFKKFNDTYGHQAGDEVLRNVAACMSEVVQQSGLVARYGGEEFAVILSHKTAEQARQLADQIRAAIENKRVDHQKQQLRVTASLGVSIAKPGAIPNAQQIIAEADKLLYAAKAKGRNRVEPSN